MSLKHNRVNRAGAYTLIELLVVIGVLLIAFSAVFIGTGSGDGARLSSAQRTLAGLVKAARSQAILKNAEVRLIIHNDPGEVDKHRRFIGIIYDEDRSSSESWVALDKGTYLPKGIYFDTSSSTNNSSLNQASWTASSNRMRINYPRLSGQGGTVGTEYFFYEFNDNGSFADGGAYLVFGAGRLLPASTEPDFPSEKLNVRAALIFRPNGTATLINDPDDI